MTEVASSCLHRATALGLLFSVLLMSGCGSSPAVPAMAAQESFAEPRAEAEASPVEEAPHVVEQSAAVEVDIENSIFFSLGSSTINHSEREKLNLLAHELKENADLSVVLIGHAYDNGSPSFNLAVADARVESVSAMLKRLGVKSRQIRKRVNGDEHIPLNCRALECRRKMRRVELIVSQAQ